MRRKNLNKILMVSLLSCLSIYGGFKAYNANASPNSQVNVTVPSDVSVIFNEDGTNTISNYNITNNSLVPITVDNINLSSKNGWSIVPSGSKILRDTKSLSLSLFNKWLNEGDNNMSVVIDEGSNKNLSPLVERGAWTKEVKESAFDLNISYNIGKKDFTLSFNPNGGNGVESIVAKNGDSVTLPSATKKGYTFTGWLDSNGIIHNAGSSYTMPIGGDELVAQWRVNKLYIQYNMNGGVLGETSNTDIGTSNGFITLRGSTIVQTFSYGESLGQNGLCDWNNLTHINISKLGYIASSGAQWNTSLDGTGTSYDQYVAYKTSDLADLSNGDVTLTLYVNWKPIKYTIYFDGNYGNSGSTASMNVDYDSSVNLSPNGFYKSSHTFTNWNTSPYGTGTSYSNNQEIKNLSHKNGDTITLYAQWEPNDISFNFKPENGEKDYSLNGLLGDMYDLTTPIKNGYDFSGWEKSDYYGIFGRYNKNNTFDNGSLGDVRVYRYGYVDSDPYGKVELVEASSDNPTSSNYEAKITSTNSYSISGRKAYVGFCTDSSTASEKSYVHTFKAKLPKGTKVDCATNSLGTGGRIVWYSEQYGTGEWETYSYIAELGSNAASSAIGYIFITSIDDTVVSAPFSWNLAYSKIMEVTNVSTDPVLLLGSDNNTLTAKWTPITYNISYNLDGGTVLSNPSSYNVNSETITLSNPVKSGSIFIGWSEKVLPRVWHDGFIDLSNGSVNDSNANWAYSVFTEFIKVEAGKTYTVSGFDGTIYDNLRIRAYDSSLNYLGCVGKEGFYDSASTGYNPSDTYSPKEDGYIRIMLSSSTYKDNISISTSGLSDSISIPSGSTGNRVYTANWKSITFKIRYNGNGADSGSMEDTSAVYGQHNYLTKNQFKKTGYTFAHWYMSREINGVTKWAYYSPTGITWYEEGKQPSGSEKYKYVDGDYTSHSTNIQDDIVTAHAQWSIVNYSISYNLNGGTNPSNAITSYNINSGAITLPTPTRTGHTFEGWFDNSSFTGTAITSIPSGSTGNKTYYAKWAVNTYYLDVSGVLDGVSEYNTVGYGTFDVYIDGVLKAQGASDYYTRHPYGTSYEIKNIVPTIGHHYVGVHSGSLKGTIGAGHTTVRLALNTNTYNVVYNANGGSGSTATSTHKYGEAKTLTPNGFSKTGYSFAGWATSASGNVVYSNSQSVSNLTATNGGTVNLYAKWTPVNYSITYNLNGGSISGQKTSYTIETSTFTLPTPSRTGYLFTGWTGSNGSTPSKSVSISKGSTGNKSYTANWTPKKLTTTFYRNQNSSDTITAQQVFTYGVSQSFSAKGWSKTGYTQLGWADSRTATTQQYSTLSGVSDGWVESKYPSNNIYAVWKPNTYSIAYNANGGTGTTATSTHTYDTAKALTSNGFSRTGYTFTGWNTQANGSGTAYSNAQSVKNLTTSNGSTVTLYAQWSVNNYTLTFNANGGSVSPASKSLAYGSQYGTLPTPTRNGYTFTGWFTAASGGTKVSNTTTMGAGNVTVYAQWAPTNYTITYNLNGGTNPSGVSTNYNINTATITLPTPNRSGYTFAGWYTNSSFTGSAVTSIAKGSTGNKVFYAKWTPVNYSISYNLNGGSVSGNPSSYNIETATFTLKNPSRTGYTFTGWTGSNGSTAQTSVSIAKSSTGNKSYTANWRANTYTVAYNANGGSGTTASSSHTYGVAKTLTANAFTRTGYTFKGWNTKPDGSGTSYTNSQSVSNLTSTDGATVTLYAQWTVNTYTYNIVYKSSTGKALGTSTVAGTFGSSKSVSAPAKTGYTTPSAQTVVFDSTSAKTITFTYPVVNYTISYNLNGGSVSGNPSSYNIESSTITLKNPSKTGNTFTGWTGSNGTTAQTSVSISSGSTGNKSYTANWRVNSYTATFNGNGGSAGTSITKPYGSQLGTLPTSSRTGYTFRGWFTATSGGTQISTTTTMPANNVTYYAQWSANTYTVNYNANGGTGTTASSSHTYGVAKALTSNGFSRTGYTFLGWSTSPSATTATYTNGQSVSNLSSTNGGTVTLYAVWKVNSYTLTFNPNGGTVSETSRKVAQGSPLGKLPVPTRPGYIFNGWFAYSYGGTQYTESSIMGSSDLTIYARWTQKTTTLIDGPSFNSTLLSMLGNCTKISFTSTSIPSNKISTAKIVSNSNSTNKAYMYVDGSTLFISPDESGVSLIAPVDCTTMFLNAKTVTTLDLSNFNLTTSTAIMKRMFQGMSSLTSLDVSKFKTSNVTDMMQTFQDCRSLTSLDVSKFSTSKVTTMNYMFYGCSSLKTLTLTPGVRPTFVTTSVTDMSFMFAGCNSLPTVNLSSFNTSKVTNMSSMFNGCLSLTSLNLANFNTSNVTSMSGMFADCRSLASLNLSSFTDYNVTNFSYMFSECINLSNLNISNMGLHKATTVREMFYNCPKLSTTVTVRGNPSNYLYMFKYTATASGSMVSVNYTSSTSALVLSMIDTKSPNSNVTLGFTVYSLDSDSSNEESNESVDGVLKPSDTLPNEQPSEELDNVVSTPQVDSNGEDELVDEPSSNVESGTSSDVENEPSSDVDDVPSEDVEEIPPTDNAEEIPSSDTIKTPSDGVPIDTPNEDIPSGNDS